MKMLLSFVVLAALALAVPTDTDVSGKWTGTFTATSSDGNHESTAYLVLKQTGSQVTGTAGPNESEQHEITKGTVSGDKVVIELQPGDGPSIKLDLVLADGRLKGKIDMSRDGETRTGTLDVGRVK